MDCLQIFFTEVQFDPMTGAKHVSGVFEQKNYDIKIWQKKSPDLAPNSLFRSETFEKCIENIYALKLLTESHYK